MASLSDHTVSGRSGHRVLIDALAARYGGTAYAVVHLANQLQERPDVAAVTVATRSGSLVAKGLEQSQQVRRLLLGNPRRGELANRLVWEAVQLPAIRRRDGSNVLITVSGMLPTGVGCPVVCLLLNPVIYERSNAANLLRRWAVARTVRRSRWVVAPSSPLAEKVSAFTGRACAVTPLGVDHSAFRPSDTPGRDVLYVADFYMHKRHDIVLAAWSLLRSPRPILRLVGSPLVEPRAYTRVLAQIEALPERHKVVVEHGLPLRGVVRAYHEARVFVLPSDHESFSMPLAESMASGVPPVVRGSGSLRDTGRCGARYIDGDDPALWASAIQELLDDDAEHGRARQVAVRAAARFSWEALASELAAHF